MPRSPVRSLSAHSRNDLSKHGRVRSDGFFGSSAAVLRKRLISSVFIICTPPVTIPTHGDYVSKSRKQKQEETGLIQSLYSHPAPPDRRAAALALASRFPEREEYVISSSEFQRAKGRAAAVECARVVRVTAPGDNGAPGRPTLNVDNQHPMIVDCASTDGTGAKTG